MLARSPSTRSTSTIISFPEGREGLEVAIVSPAGYIATAVVPRRLSCGLGAARSGCRPYQGTRRR